MRQGLLITFLLFFASSLAWAQETTYTITGAVGNQTMGIEGVPVVLGGSVQDTTVTNAAGEFTFENLMDGSYTLMPKSDTLVFSPTMLTLELANGVNTSVPIFEVAVSTAQERTEQPLAPRLFQNAPNPFQESTIITYHLTRPTPVRLDIFDVLGRQLHVLVDGLQEAGVHRARFGDPSLRPGVYFYRLTAGQTSETRRMILTR